MGIPQEIEQAIANGNGRNKLMESFGLTDYKARNYINEYKKRGGKIRDGIKENSDQLTCSTQLTNNGGTIILITQSVPEPEEIFEKSGVDPNLWEIVDIQISEWTTPMKTKQSDKDEKEHKIVEQPHIIKNYRVSVKIKPKKSAPFETALRELVENLPKLPKAPLIIHKGLNKELAGEIIPVDAHIGKLAWHQETGQGDMDLKIAAKKWFEGVGKSIAHIEKYKPSVIYLVLGNDMQHYENMIGETWKGHNRLDTDSRLPKIIRRINELCLQTIDLCLEIAPTNVVVVPGNHDNHASMWFHELLMQLEKVKGKKWAKIDSTVGNYKHTVFGNLLVVWGHDYSASKKKRGVNDIPHRFRKEWGQTKWAEVHYGHKHKKEEWEFMKLSSPGQCIFRQCSGLTTIDYWHMDTLFTDAVPASEAFLWDSKWGVEANFTSNVDWTEAIE